MSYNRLQDTFKFPPFALLAAFLFAASTAFAATNAVETFSRTLTVSIATPTLPTSASVNGQPSADGVVSRPTDLPSRSTASLDCIDCHDGIKEMVHDKNMPPPNCTGCHDKEGKDYATSIHGMSHAMGASGAAQCWDCHGSHEILPVKRPGFAGLQTEPAGRPAPNATATPNLTKEYQIEFPEAASQYMDSIHGTRAVENGVDRRAIVQ